MTLASERFEHVRTAIPGPRSRALRALLERYEERGVTYLADDFPVFWDRAHGALVTDVDGNRYIDLTAAFGVANVGHANPAVVEAVGAQAGRLVHAMGDVHPAAVKAHLLEALAAVAPGDLQKTYLATGGAEAVEFARKTALLATGKPGVLAYRGAYHGLLLGALDVTGIAKFRDPFAPLIAAHTTWLDFPAATAPPAHALAQARAALDADAAIGALICEPVQGRGGVVVPPSGFLRGLRALCDERGIVLILDEMFTGFGRTGRMFACEREDVVPDLLCVGKALAGGIPFAATIGRPHVMDAWSRSDGEALHTSTFLGNPVACAAALATLAELRRLDVVGRVQRGEAAFGARLRTLRDDATAQIVDVRGVGYFWALQCRSATHAARAVARALAKGVIVLQAGPLGDALSFTPPLTIDDDQLARAIDLVGESLRETA